MKAAPFAVWLQQKKPLFKFALPLFSRYPRACTWLSLGESWRDARKGGETERGASHACGTAQLRRILRMKQPKRSRGSGLSFARAQRRPKQKQGTATMPPQAAERARTEKGTNAA